ncbi:DMT family transporter [Telluribacter sp.]|jgi:transporter family-2 protein|uniref:DMT family transporter n=1 Tax=Telluribacter sp. TaxID=1978767 RepID=UPI002E119758|nr:DMT family transporter [Telluribacter sp.]
MNYFFLLLAFLIGVGTAVQGGVNSQLRLSLGNPILAALFSFVIGLLALLIAFAAFNQNDLPSVHTIRHISWWKFLGGLFGAFYVLTVIFVVRDIGQGALVCLAVAGQLIAAVVIDHYGLLGFAVHQVSLPRLLGVVLLIIGAVLIVRH